MAAALGAGLLTATGPPARAVPTAGLTWSARSDPSSITNVLTGVSAVSASDAWAVGYYVSNGGPGPVDNTLILRWNGTAWSRVRSPNPSPAINHLYGVSAVSATSAWAAGNYYNSTTKATGTLILRWNGTAWSKVTSPSPSSSFSSLGGVSAVSGNDAWTVGEYTNPTTGATGTLTLRWNGTAWSDVPSPSPGATANGLRGVSTVSPADAWAVGSYHDDSTNTTHTLILHWHGTTWSVS